MAIKQQSESFELTNIIEAALEAIPSQATTESILYALARRSENAGNRLVDDLQSAIYRSHDVLTESEHRFAEAEILSEAAHVVASLRQPADA